MTTQQNLMISIVVALILAFPLGEYLADQAGKSAAIAVQRMMEDQRLPDPKNPRPSSPYHKETYEGVKSGYLPWITGVLGCLSVALVFFVLEVSRKHGESRQSNDSWNNYLQSKLTEEPAAETDPNS